MDDQIPYSFLDSDSWGDITLYGGGVYVSPYLPNVPIEWVGGLGFDSIQDYLEEGGWWDIAVGAYEDRTK